MVARHFTPLLKVRTPVVRLSLISIAVAGLGACSMMHHASSVPPSPPPPPADLERHETPMQAHPSASAMPKGCADEKCARRVLAMHRQYFDQRHKRYYYYDPAHRAYFWEDGTPKS